MTTIPRGLGLKQVLVLRALASFDHSDPKRYWPLSVINERARPTPGSPIHHAHSPACGAVVW
jgi:hypothetical protein